MKRTTSQWRSVSSAIPFSPAIASAIASFHCSGSVRKPSASTSTGASAMSVMVISSLLSRRDGQLLASGGHGRTDPRDLPAWEQRVPVGPLERELSEVVQSGLAQERQAERAR